MNRGRADANPTVPEASREANSDHKQGGNALLERPTRSRSTVVRDCPIAWYYGSP